MKLTYKITNRVVNNDVEVRSVHEDLKDYSIIYNSETWTQINTTQGPDEDGDWEDTIDYYAYEINLLKDGESVYSGYEICAEGSDSEDAQAYTNNEEFAVFVKDLINTGKGNPIRILEKELVPDKGILDKIKFSNNEMGMDVHKISYGIYKNHIIIDLYKGGFSAEYKEGIFIEGNGDLGRNWKPGNLWFLYDLFGCSTAGDESADIVITDTDEIGEWSINYDRDKTNYIAYQPTFTLDWI